MLGFVLSDVSPAVTVPLLLDFILGGYGKAKGIPTILLAASGFNGVMSITAFGIMMSFVFATGQATWLTCALGATQIVGGLMLGYVVGYIVALTWEWAPGNSDYWRFSLLLLHSFIGIFVGKLLGMSGGGTLAVVFAGIVMKAYLETKMVAVEKIFAVFWASAGQTLLFGLLGAQVQLSKLTPTMCKAAVVVIMVALLFRFLATMACVQIGAKDWTNKEKLFAGISWCPKATVQVGGWYIFC